MYHSRERSDSSRQQHKANTMNIPPNPFDRDESVDDAESGVRLGKSNYIAIDLDN